MRDSDESTSTLSITKRITESEISTVVSSRALTAIDQLIGVAAEIGAAKLEHILTRMRGQDSPSDDVDQCMAALGNDALASHVQRTINKAEVVERSVRNLVDWCDSLPSPEDEGPDESKVVDPDWLNFFGDYADKASTDKVRELWAQVLSGEIRRPGSFSLSTLRILSELDQTVASYFEQEVEFRFRGNCIVRARDTTLEGEKLDRLVLLEQTGLIYQVPSIGGMVLELPLQHNVVLVREGSICLKLVPEQQKALDLPVIPLTRVGRQIAQILPPVDSIAVLKLIGSTLEHQVKAMTIHDVLPGQKGPSATVKDTFGIVTQPIETLK